MGLVRITPINTAVSSVQTKSVSNATTGFGQALKTELDKQSDVKISAHAQKRLDERNVHMNDTDQARLSAAMDKVQNKGADKSLVLLDNLALVVSARNRVVITALDSASSKDGVFTGIDSAVIA